MKFKNKIKSAISTALAVIMLVGTIPITTTFAAQVNEYTDPADSWVSANGRTNELDVNATTTYETQRCIICDKDTTVLTYRVPEYTRSGETAANRGVRHSDGANDDGTEYHNLDDGTPGINSYYTSHHWTKSVCQTCGTINSGDGLYAYSLNRNVYSLNTCDHNFFLDFDNTTYEPYNSTYHTTTLKKGQYCMFCKGTEARATEKQEKHDFTEHIDAQIGNNRFYISETCEDCGYETSEYVTAKSVVSSYYGTADGEAHTLTVSDLSDSGVKTSIRYGTEADNCTKTSAPNYVQSGYYNIYYQITYSYGGESMIENGVSYVWLIDDNSDEDENGTIIVVPPAHEHDYRYLESVPSTCENLGYERWQCDGCGELVKMNYSPAIGHNHKGIVIKEPTCKQGGLTLYLCSNCGDFFEETTATGEHSYEAHTHNSTCQSVGYTENKCTVCDYSYLTDITPLITHSYEKVTKAPSCTEKGYTTSICTMCNLTNISDYTEPMGHAWNEGETVTSSTCEAEGVIQFSCENCNEKMIKATNANGHTLGAAATCTEPQTCEDCGTVLEMPTGHSYTENIIAPTCVEMGYSIFECSSCHDSYTGNYTDKAEHDYEKTTKDPSCAEMGHTLYDCVNCDYSFISDYTDKEPHDFAEEITKPTCAEFGYSVFTCKNCPESYVGNYQDKLPHNYDKQIIPPTCTEHGYTVYKCPDCENEYISDFVNCEQHTYTKTVIAPDCLNMGYTIYKCESCPEEYKADYINAKGHTPSDWIIDVTPTIENGGTKHIECTECKEVLQTAELAQLIDKDNTDEDGNAKVGAFSIILTDKNNKPIFNSEISIDINDLITIKLPSGRLLDYNDPTTITAFYTDTQKAAAELNIFIEDINGNHATGKTDGNGQLIVPNGESSTGNDNGTIGNEDNENKFTYVVRVTDRFNVTVPNCNIKIGESNNIVVKLPEGHILTEDSPTIITVTDHNGNAQKGVSVIVIADKDYIEKGITDMYGKLTVPPVNTGYTDKDGKVSLQTYYIFVNDEAKAIVNALVKLNEDNTISVKLPDESVIAHSNRITVTVLTSNGESVKDMTVSVSDITENSYTDITNEQGKITVPPLSEDYTDNEGKAKVNGFNILVNDEIGNIENAFITISADNAITVKLPEANRIDIENRISVTVTDSENNAVKSMSVTVTDTAEQTATDLTDDNGKITVPPTNIDYTDKDGNGQINGYLVNVKNETNAIEKAFISIDENNLISVTLPEDVKFTHSNRITVTVLNKADNTPAPSLNVTVSETVIKADEEADTEDSEQTEATEPTPKTLNGITDVNGVVVFPSLTEDYTDKDGVSSVNDYTVTVKNTTENIENAFIEIKDGKISVKLPENYTLTTSNQTTVIVTDKDGKGVQGVSVTVADKTTSKTATTDTDGKITVPVKTSGGGSSGGSSSRGGGGGGSYYSATVKVTDQNGKTVNVTKSVTSTKATLTLTSGYKLADNYYTITVTSSNKPKADYTVILKDKDGKETTGTTDTNGVVILPSMTHTAYVVGYPDGSFKPDGDMTRGEAAAIFARLVSEQKGESISGKPSFSDVSKNDWHYSYIGYLEKYGIIKGYNDNSFKPDDSVTRAEFVAMAVRYYDIFNDVSKGSYTVNYTDLEKSYWAYSDIAYAKHIGWLNGYADGTFKGDNNITRAEVVTVVNKATGRTADESYIDKNISVLNKYTDLKNNSHWAYYSIYEASNSHKAVSGSNGEEWTK